MPRLKAVDSQRLLTTAKGSGPRSSNSFDYGNSTSPDPQTWALPSPGPLHRLRYAIQRASVEQLPARAQLAEDVRLGSRAPRCGASSVGNLQRGYDSSVMLLVGGGASVVEILPVVGSG